MQKELLVEYVKLDQEFKLLEDKKQELRERIVADFKKNKLEKVESEFGNFTICEKETWKYTDAVKKIEDRLKIARIKEQDKGIATASTSEYLLFKGNEKEEK